MKLDEYSILEMVSSMENKSVEGFILIYLLIVVCFFLAWVLQVRKPPKDDKK